MIDGCPFVSPKVFALQDMLNEPYDEEEYGKLLGGASVFKLSYKFPLIKEKNGKPTYYGWLTDRSEVSG